MEKYDIDNTKYKRVSRFDDQSEEEELDPQSLLMVDMKSFVLININKKQKEIGKSKALEKNYKDLKTCCGKIKPELEHWNQLRVLIMSRETLSNDPCWLLPYDTKKVFHLNSF